MWLSDSDRALIASWLRSFVAAALTSVMAGATDPRDIARAGIIAIIPPILRWLNPRDQAFGRGATGPA